MANPNAEQVAQRACDLGLLTDRQLQEIWTTLGSRAVPLNTLLQALVRREYLTSYQVERLVQGDRTGFFYGPYKVLYVVGSGAFARVFRAVHRETGEVVAIKALRTRYGENAAQSSQFVREGRVGITLRHPNIVPTYDVVSDGKSHFLVMEFVEGWNLRDFVKIRKKVEPIQATRLLMNMAEGLRYAADLGLTHRDLKLNNVLVTVSGQAKLVDFGLAAMDETFGAEAMSDLPANTRTVDYAALERATGVRKDDTRSDLYFLGCIYYHMLTGQAPLPEARDQIQRLAKQRFLDVPPIEKLEPTLSPVVIAVVNKSMALDPAKRYQTAADLLIDLAAAEAKLLEEAELGITHCAAPVAAAPPAAVAEKQRAVMVVESDQKMQDIFREGLKRAGYRVLVTGDAERAIGRFRQDSSLADCVVFNAQGLGDSALTSFNMLGDDTRTRYVRAILLLGENQKDWQNRAMVTKHRIVVTMPITMGKLRTSLAALLEVQ